MISLNKTDVSKIALREGCPRLVWDLNEENLKKAQKKFHRK